MSGPTYDAAAMLLKSSTDHGIKLVTLVAETGLWASPKVHQQLIQTTGGVAFFPDRRRYRAGQGEKAGQKLGALTLDNNSYANHAIKRALGLSRENLVGFETCHVWPRTCYNERYHTAIANLVLLPRAIAGLTDHNAEVQTALQYRSYEVYGWHPEEVSTPIRPVGYPEKWSDPLPFSDSAERAVGMRLQRLGLIAATSDGAGLSKLSQQVPLSRLDVTVGKTATHGLPSRIAILTVARGLVSAGVSPKEIASVLHWRGNRVFRSAAGHLTSNELVRTLSLEAERCGKRFDPVRFFCEEPRVMFSHGRSYVFNNQWTGADAKKGIAQLAAAFPDHNVSFTVSGDGGAEKRMMQSRQMTSKQSASIRERLHGLASFTAAFEAPGFAFGHWKQSTDERGVIVPPHFTLGETGAEFVMACYDLGWIWADFDWPEWKETPEALRLRDDPAGIENAAVDDLAKLLTVLVRQDRFVEGGLSEAFEAGLLIRIVRRCAILENTPAQ